MSREENELVRPPKIIYIFTVIPLIAIISFAKRIALYMEIRKFNYDQQINILDWYDPAGVWIIDSIGLLFSLAGILISTILICLRPVGKTSRQYWVFILSPFIFFLAYSLLVYLGEEIMYSSIYTIE
jgi:hypothetical protein